MTGRGASGRALQQEARSGDNQQPVALIARPTEGVEVGKQWVGCRLIRAKMSPSAMAAPGLATTNTCPGEPAQEAVSGGRGCSLVIERSDPATGHRQILRPAPPSAVAFADAGVIRPQGGEELLHRQIDLLGRQQGRGVVPAPSSWRWRCRSRSAGPPGEYPHGEQQGVAWQVVKQAGGLVEEQRQIVFVPAGQRLCSPPGKRCPRRQISKRSRYWPRTVRWPLRRWEIPGRARLTSVTGSLERWARDRTGGWSPPRHRKNQCDRAAAFPMGKRSSREPRAA